jgi:aminotransferase
MAATMLALVNGRKDRVPVVHENYGRTRSCAARRRASSGCGSLTGRSIPVNSAAFGNRTKAIVINTPNNPTGKVFRGELEQVAALCRKWDVTPSPTRSTNTSSTTAVHASRRLRGMRRANRDDQRHLKSYSLTGWRVGYARRGAVTAASGSSIF